MWEVIQGPGKPKPQPQGEKKKKKTLLAKHRLMSMITRIIGLFTIKGYSSALLLNSRGEKKSDSEKGSV